MMTGGKQHSACLRTDRVLREAMRARHVPNAHSRASLADSRWMKVDSSYMMAQIRRKAGGNSVPATSPGRPSDHFLFRRRTSSSCGCESVRSDGFCLR